MPSYIIEYQDPREGWRPILNFSGENGPDAFERFNDQEHLEAGEYRFRPSDDDKWEYVTLTEDGAEIFTD